MPVVGFLRSTPAAVSAHLVSAFRQGLTEAGFVEGQNVVIEYRWAEGHHDRLAGLAADLVRRGVAAILAQGFAVPLIKAATAGVPVVFTTGMDPVRTGLVSSLSRPGGHVTGVVFTITDLTTKRLALLHELIPGAGVIAVLADTNRSGNELEFQELETAGRAIGRKIVIVKAANERELEAAFVTMVQAGASALLVLGGPVFLSHRRQLVALATRHGLPASYVVRDYPEAGGLMSYGPSQTEAYRRAAGYIGRILKGAKPSDLPVELASKFDLVINLATAKGMGLEIPPMLLARADEVIE